MGKKLSEVAEETKFMRKETEKNDANKTSPLKNSANDARDFARSLKVLGFDVILKENADQKIMEKSIRRFGEQLRDGN